MQGKIIGIALAVLIVAMLVPLGLNQFINSANEFNTTDSFTAVAGAGTPEVVVVRHPPVKTTPDQVVKVEGVVVTPSAQNDTTGTYTIDEAEVAAGDIVTVQYEWNIANDSMLGPIFALVAIFAMIGLILLFVNLSKSRGKG